MLRLVFFTFCIGGMIAFYFFVRWVVYYAPGTFGDGFTAGIFFIVLLFFLLERAKIIAIVELAKGTWIPHRRDQRRDKAGD